MSDLGYVVPLMAICLLATLALESLYALLWGVRREDFRTVLLANALTNPAVVLLTQLACDPHDSAAIWILLGLELAAVAVEALLYARRTRIRLPWAFSLCANALSFIAGLFLTI